MTARTDDCAELTMPLDLPAESTVPKIRLRVSCDSSGVNAEMITPGSDQAEELPTATESHTSQFLIRNRHQRKPRVCSTMMN